MKHSTMANLLRGVIILLVLCGVFVHLYLLPNMFVGGIYRELVTGPWLILAAIALIPCYAVTVIAWQIAGSIEKEREFCHRNATRFRWIFGLALSDSAVFLVGSVILFLIGRAYAWCVLGAVVLAALGVCVAIAAAVMSHLIDRAAVMQDDADLTI